MKPRSIFFVGPCHKIDRRSGELFPPFSPESRSGRFLRGLLPANLTGVNVRFENILSTAFFDAAGRECNPKAEHLVQALLAHGLWCDADVVVALGSEVHAAFRIVQSDKKAGNRTNEIVVEFFEHPSYILRRPKMERDRYVQRIAGVVAVLQKTVHSSWASV